jgi:hypothetical protein
MLSPEAVPGARHRAPWLPLSSALLLDGLAAEDRLLHTRGTGVAGARTTVAQGEGGLAIRLHHARSFVCTASWARGTYPYTPKTSGEPGPTLPPLQLMTIVLFGSSAGVSLPAPPPPPRVRLPRPAWIAGGAECTRATKPSRAVTSRTGYVCDSSDGAWTALGCGAAVPSVPSSRCGGGERGARGRGREGADEGEDTASGLGRVAQEDVRLRRVCLREVWRQAQGSWRTEVSTSAVAGDSADASLHPAKAQGPGNNPP